MRGSRATHSLQRGTQFQIVQPVDRFHVDAAPAAALLDIERNRRAGSARRPDLAIEIRQAARRFAGDADDLIALADAGLLGRTVGCDTRHDEPPAPLVSRNAKPRPPVAGDSSVRDQIAKNWRQSLDRYEHVARRAT